MIPFDSQRKATILIIDDEPANLAVLVKYLESYGLDIVVAQTGERGLERAAFVLPDLILLDILMPGINGIETCRRLKMDQRTSEIPVIFMTALTDVEEKVNGFEVGGVDYITKPIELDEARARINTHLTIGRLQHDLRQSEEKYRRLIEGAPAIVYLFSPERGGIFYSKGVESLLGYSVSYLYEHPFLWNDSIYPDDLGIFKKCIDTFVEGKSFDIEYRIKDAHGNWRWFRDLSIGKRMEGNDVLIEGIAYDITARKQSDEEREKLITKLQATLAEIKTLRGILPICSFCKKIRTDDGYWEQVDIYIGKHSQADISHGICPKCLEINYPEYTQKSLDKKENLE